MAGKTKKKYPAIKGLTWHREDYFSFFIPRDWHKFEWADERQGVIYGPDQSDPLTIFAVEFQNLGTLIAADDLDILAEGFYESIEQLPGVEIESRKQKVTGKLLELEAKYTYEEQGDTRKRWVRQFYQDTRQIVMTAQGKTPEQYDYWLPLFFEAMMTAKVHYRKPDLEALT